MSCDEPVGILLISMKDMSARFGHPLIQCTWMSAAAVQHFMHIKVTEAGS
jgi:hypothetical protein